MCYSSSVSKRNLVVLKKSFTPQSEGGKNIAGETSHGFNSSMRGFLCLRAGHVWCIKRPRLDLAISSEVSGRYGTENASAALRRLRAKQ